MGNSNPQIICLRGQVMIATRNLSVWLLGPGFAKRPSGGGTEKRRFYWQMKIGIEWECLPRHQHISRWGISSSSSPSIPSILITSLPWVIWNCSATLARRRRRSHEPRNTHKATSRFHGGGWAEETGMSIEARTRVNKFLFASTPSNSGSSNLHDFVLPESQPPTSQEESVNEHSPPPPPVHTTALRSIISFRMSAAGGNFYRSCSSFSSSASSCRNIIYFCFI